jgi:hypothetical protein
MTNGAYYKRGKLHHSPWHSDICTSNQLYKNNRSHSLRYKENYAGTGENNVRHFESVGIMTLEECNGAVQLWK